MTVMQPYTACWLGFVMANAMNKSAFHFFPVADNVTGPYPVVWTLSLFGVAGKERTVTIEGGRLSNPDGVRLEDAFPELRSDLTGIFGLWVELVCQQPRVNLTGSSAVIELISHGHELRFRPRQIAQGDMGVRQMALPTLAPAQRSKRPPFSTQIAIRDSLQTTSIVAVNATDMTIRVLCASLPHGNADSGHFLGEVPSRSVSEIALGESFYEGALQQECSWGTLKARPIEISVDAPAMPVKQSIDGGDEALFSAIAFYLVYRDAGTRRITGVIAL